MKKNIKKVSKPKSRIPGRVKWFAVLMFLQAALANAVEGVVLRTISSPTESRVMLDTTGDGQADMYIPIPRNREPTNLYERIRGCFERGAIVDIDDEWIMPDDRDMLFSYLGGVISVNSTGMLSAFPGQGDIFEAAAERRREERKRQNQQRGSR